MEHELGDLPELLESEEIDAVAVVSSLVCDDEARRLTLALRLRNGDELDVERVVVCDGVVRWAAEDGVIVDVHVRDDHPALREFTDQQAALYFTDAPADVARAADRVHGALARTAGPAWSASVRLNHARGGFEHLLREGRGLAALGPESLLAVIGRVLEEEGVRTSLVDQGPPEMYDPDLGELLPPPAGLGVLDLRAVWVVAQRFTVCPNV